ncbi:MarR family winged helix-turn-helix transcriptional regulator [Aeromicrobium sp. UC242_57]|uniref:MarR family winged helix-turn-helix transcriptional regulator n=1 Tax=Aeromicrobium sp. UC242_57 TaxID=3374624 RepID=UPI00379759F8
MPQSSAPRPFDDDELQTWSAVATVLEWLPSALDAQLVRDSGLTHFEYGILFALSGATEGTLRMSTLAHYSNSSLSRLSRAVARLEKKAWVQRRPDPADGRYTLATLTDEGLQRAQQATPGHVDNVRHLVFDSLTSAQARQLREISHRILGSVRPDGAWQAKESRSSD